MSSSYDPDLLKQLGSRLSEPELHNSVCKKCRSLLVEAFQFACCGELCCKLCLTNECRFCSQHGINHVDKRTSNAVNKMQFQCLFTSCTYTGTVSDLRSHYDNQKCQTQPIPCQYCKSQFARGTMPHHQDSCDFLPYKCDCGENLVLKDKENHEVKNCELTKIKCPHRKWSGCQFIDSRKTMKDHVKVDHTKDAILFVGQLQKSIEEADQKQNDAEKLAGEREARLQITINELSKAQNESTLEIAKLKRELKTMKELRSSERNEVSVNSRQRSALLNRTSSSTLSSSSSSSGF